MTQRLVVGISGASGIILAKKLIESVWCEVDLVITQQAVYTMRYELDIFSVKQFLNLFSEEVYQRIKVHAINDIGSSISSGSHKTIGMVVIPCSMATVAAISTGLGDNGLRRAADVTIKEKRPLILVPRETPFSEIHLENLLKLARMGVTVVPPIPAWYTRPQTLEDVENFIVGKVLDALKMDHDLYPRWKGGDDGLVADRK